MVCSIVKNQERHLYNSKSGKVWFTVIWPADILLFSTLMDNFWDTSCGTKL